MIDEYEKNMAASFVLIIAALAVTMCCVVALIIYLPWIALVLLVGGGSLAIRWAWKRSRVDGFWDQL